MRHISHLSFRSFMFLFFATTLFAGGFFVSIASAEAVKSSTIVAWNFPIDPDDAIADAGIPSNSAKSISAVGTAVPIFSTDGATTQSAKATGWNSGADIKYWIVEFDTTGYEDITLSSKQRSSGTGPRDFTVQYKIGAGDTWTNLGSSLTLADNWTSGVLSGLLLPSETGDKTSVSIRWVMTTNISVSSTSVNVASGGVSNVDDIIILGNEILPDGDGDEVADMYDNCVSIANPDRKDTDGDGFGDVCDNSPMVSNPNQEDSDGDGVGDASDNCPSTPNTDQADTDSDTIGNLCDNSPNTVNQDQKDTDADTVGDVSDNCLLLVNKSQTDGDTDNIGDSCDNCPLVPNTSQIDTNTNGVGDTCEPVVPDPDPVDPPPVVTDPVDPPPVVTDTASKPQFAGGGKLLKTIQKKVYKAGNYEGNISDTTPHGEVQGVTTKRLHNTPRFKVHLTTKTLMRYLVQKGFITPENEARAIKIASMHTLH